MTFGQRVAMTLRQAALEVLFGLAIAGLGVYGLMTYKPIPNDAPFASPIPFTAVFWAGIMIGVGLIVWGHFKANRE
ncbi:hypothetical protein ACM7I8_23755 [Pseudomonas aeruginosa]